MRVKLLLLDFDGTLVDTRQSNFCAYRDVLAQIGVTLEEDKYINTYFGMRCGEFMRLLGLEDSHQIDSLRREKIEIYHKYFHLITLNESLWAFAQTFRAQGGKVWIASVAQADNIRNVMEHFNLTDMVDGIITGADVSRCKPDPECFLKAMEAEGVAPEECIIFEDSATGLAAAQASGAPYIQVKM